MPTAGEAIGQIVDVLLRYVHGDAYGESELESVMAALPLMEPMELRAVEFTFVEHHIEFVRMRCQERLLKLRSQLEGLQLLGAVLQLWSSTVMPQQLVPILTTEGIEAVRNAFAASVRYYINFDSVLRALITGSMFQHTDDLKAMSNAGLDDEANTVLSRCIPLEISRHIEKRYTREYDENIYSQIEGWLRSVLFKTVEAVLEPQLGSKSELPEGALLRLALEALARLRIGEIYHLVATTNVQGLHDLRRTLLTPELRNEAVDAFSQQCYERLLNGGSDTVDIIQMYLKTIKGFSIIDPRGVLLERVSEPIQQLLKERADTSVVLAEGLFGVSHSPLAFMAREIGERPHVREAPKGCGGFRDWRPDPVDAPVDYVRKQGADNVAALISLYDNKEVFVKQFSSLYGNELLNISFDTSGIEALSRLEQHYTHLAQRFGESNLHKIAVMLSDMRYSHDTATQIHGTYAELGTISGIVLSRLYWPSISAGKAPPLQLPPSVNQRIQDYAAAYQGLEGHEALEVEWIPNRGRVSLEIELQDRKLDLVVEPEQAILITAFENATTSSLALVDLLEMTKLSEPSLLSAIQYWVSQGVVGTIGEKYKILETSDEVEAQAQSHTQIVTSIDLGTHTTSKKTASDPFEDMQVYWSYINGMLTNLGALPLEKIHSFLVLFVPKDDPYVKTKQELENYLLSMIDEQKLQMEDGKFRLPKKAK